MAIILDTLTLPPNLMWSDELSWCGGQAATDRSIEGLLVVWDDAVLDDSGRPVTLRHPEDGEWISRADMLTLQSWASQVNKRMTLTIWDGRSFTVRFRREEQPCIDSSPLHDFVDPESTDLYKLRELRLAVL